MSLSLEPPPLSNPKSGAQPKRRFTSVRTGLPLSNHPRSRRASRFSLYPSLGSIAVVTAVLKTEEGKNAVTGKEQLPVRIVAVVGEGSVSPLKCATWEEVMLHTVSSTFSSVKLPLPHQKTNNIHMDKDFKANFFFPFLF